MGTLSGARDVRLLLSLFALVLLAPTALASIDERPLPKGWEGPARVAFDAHGQLWITLEGSWAIARYDPGTGTGQIYKLPVPKPDPEAAVGGLAFGPDGIVWTGTGTHLLGLNPTNGSFLVKRLPNPGQLGGDIYVAPDDTLYYALVDRDEIVHLDARTGEIESLPLPSQPFGPIGFASTGSGSVLVTATYGNLLATFEPDNGTLDLSAKGIQGPIGVAHAGSTAYVAEMGANTISRVMLPTGELAHFATSPSPYYPLSGPAGVLIAKDGSIWFAEHFADKIARFDPANLTLHEYEAPSAPGTNLQYVTQAGDGRIWFAEASTNKLGIATYTHEEPPALAVSNVTMRAGDTTRLDLGAASAGLLANGPGAWLNATMDGQTLVLKSTKEARGDQFVLLTNRDGKDHAGRYLIVHMEDAKPSPSAPLLLALGAVGFVATLLRRRRA